MLSVLDTLWGVCCDDSVIRRSTAREVRRAAAQGFKDRAGVLESVPRLDLVAPAGPQRLVQRLWLGLLCRRAQQQRWMVAASYLGCS
jgi:hypothetical protein